MKDFILQLKQKPEHIRKRVAVGTSAAVTGLVGVVWLTTMATTGVFALSTQPKDASSQNDASSFALSGTDSQSNFTQLLGAVGAVSSGTTSKPALTIVDGETSSSFKTATTSASQATVIPF